VEPHALAEIRIERDIRLQQREMRGARLERVDIDAEGRGGERRKPDICAEIDHACAAGQRRLEELQCAFLKPAREFGARGGDNRIVSNTKGAAPALDRDPSGFDWTLHPGPAGFLFGRALSPG
jgi:hypothetical protein